MELQGYQVVVLVVGWMADCQKVVVHAVELRTLEGLHLAGRRTQVEAHTQVNARHSQAALRNRAAVVRGQEAEHQNQELHSRVARSHIPAVDHSLVLREARNPVEHHSLQGHSLEHHSLEGRNQAWASARIPAHPVAFHVAVDQRAKHHEAHHVVEHHAELHEQEHRMAAADHHAEEHRASAGRRNMERQEVGHRMASHLQAEHLHLRAESLLWAEALRVGDQMVEHLDGVHHAEGHRVEEALLQGAGRVPFGVARDAQGDLGRTMQKRYPLRDCLLSGSCLCLACRPFANRYPLRLSVNHAFSNHLNTDFLYASHRLCLDRSECVARCQAQAAHRMAQQAARQTSRCACPAA